MNPKSQILVLRNRHSTTLKASAVSVCRRSKTSARHSSAWISRAASRHALELNWTGEHVIALNKYIVVVDCISKCFNYCFDIPLTLSELIAISDVYKINQILFPQHYLTQVKENLPKHDSTRYLQVAYEVQPC